MTNFKNRNFLKLLDYTPAEIQELIDLAAKLKAEKKAGIPHRMHEGKNIVLLFEKDSTRTRCAFEVAGADLVYIGGVNEKTHENSLSFLPGVSGAFPSL